MNEKRFDMLRRHMVEVIALTAELGSDSLGKASLDKRVMAAMGRVPRHAFVPQELVPYAYENSPLPIGFGKTISQPFIVAVMTDLLDTRSNSVVLEVGTGLGYHASILAELVRQVWSVEIVEEFATEAAERIQRLGYANVGIRTGDGSKGWPELAPFDRIIVTAAAEHIPSALIEQLKPGGRMVLPIGQPEAQKLAVLEKDANGETHTHLGLPVRFTALETVR